MLKSQKIFAGLLAFRLINCLVVRGYFSPDEYWQSLEVAHKMVFGYGELTWEWEESALRSVIHPGFFAFFYYFLAVAGLDTPWLIAYLPRLIQGILLVLTEYFIYKAAGKNAIFYSAGSWFMWYAGVRTYSNSFEMLFNAIALYFQVSNQVGLWNVFVGISCMFRPTSLIIWLPSYFYYLYTRKLQFFLSTILTG